MRYVGADGRSKKNTIGVLTLLLDWRTCQWKLVRGFLCTSRILCPEKRVCKKWSLETGGMKKYPETYLKRKPYPGWQMCQNLYWWFQLCKTINLNVVVLPSWVFRTLSKKSLSYFDILIFWQMWISILYMHTFYYRFYNILIWLNAECFQLKSKYMQRVHHELADYVKPCPHFTRKQYSFAVMFSTRLLKPTLSPKEHETISPVTGSL